MITEKLLKECHKEFEAFFQSLIIGTTEIQHKVDEVRSHSLRVAQNSQLIAKVVLQNDEEKYIAELIALLHDLGKAAMLALGTESATTIQRDHASESAKLIQKMTFYSNLSDEEQLIFVKSVENHSKIKLPKLDNEQQTTFARILRDADKLDVYDSSYRFFKERYGNQPIATFDLINHPEVSEKIMKSILSGKSAMVEDMKTMNDYKLVLLAMAFDLNYKITFKIMSEKQYVQKIYETLPKRDQIIDAYRAVKLFVENKFVS